jgi:hypothetical protein
VAAAVVRYIRCFGTGVRWGLRREDILELGERELSAHDYFKDLRDKFVVHSVNPFEDTFVTAVASEWDGVRHPITSLGWAQNRRALSPDIAFVLARLAAGVRAVIQQWVAVEERRLLAVIQALPLDTIHNGDLNSPRLIKDSDVSKSRKQKTRSRPPRKRRAAAK